MKQLRKIMKNASAVLKMCKCTSPTAKEDQITNFVKAALGPPHEHAH